MDWVEDGFVVCIDDDSWDLVIGVGVIVMLVVVGRVRVVRVV